MPVAGLPAAVEVVVSTLLTTQRLTSWKVAGESETTVLVLRFRQDGSQPCTASESSRGQWRRKPPSQLRRDQQRAQGHGQSGEHVSSPPALAENEPASAATSDVLSSCCKSSSDAQPESSTTCRPRVTSDLPCTRTDLQPSQAGVLLSPADEPTDTASTVVSSHAEYNEEESGQGNDTGEKHGREATMEDFRAALDALAVRIVSDMHEQCESLRVGSTADRDALNGDSCDAETGTVGCDNSVTSAPLSTISNIKPHRDPVNNSWNSTSSPVPRGDAASAVTVEKRANNEAESGKSRDRTVLHRCQPQRAVRK